MATQTVDLILNGDFSDGSIGNWSNWSSSGTFLSAGGGDGAPTVGTDGSSDTLTYTGLEGLDVGPGANGAGQVSMDIGWSEFGDESSIEIRLGGVLLATITTQDGSGTTASITYAAGVSGNLSSLAVSPGAGSSYALESLVIDLPASIPATGSLEISTSLGGDDFRVDNVAVLVSETVLDAVDDLVTVSESEGSGDTDGNVLTSNDSFDTATVTEVNGVTGNVGVAVDGTTGGTFTIQNDGTLDFDADGDFESLGVGESAVTEVTYTIQSPSPFDAGSQSAQTSTTVGSADQQAFFSVTANELTSDGNGNVSATISLSAITQPTYNILFVMDVSGSTGFSTPLFDMDGDGDIDADDTGSAGDLNDDGDGAEVIDAEIAAFRQLSTDIAALGFSDADLQIGFVTFEDDSPSGDSGTEIILEGVGDQSFDAGSTSLSNALNVGGVGGGTDFESALQLAITWFNGQPAADNNIIYFLSDGVHNGGTFTDEVTTLQDASGINAEINAVGITSSSSLTQLNQIDNTVGSGQTAGSSADQITTLAELNAALQPPFLDVAITDLRVFVDGVQDLTIDETDLVVSGSGFELSSTAISGLMSTPNSSSTIRFEVEFDDGTIMSNELVVDAVAEDTATVSVTVTGENDLPVAVDDGATVGEDDAGVTPIDILANDSDPDATDVLTIKSVDDTGTQGTVTVNDNGTPGDASDDFVDYDPNGQFESLGVGETAIDTFTYVVTDGEGGSDTATVSVTVTGANDDPVAVDDGATVGEDDAGVTPINVLANDSDPDATDVLTIKSVDDTGTQGTVTVNDNGTPGDASDDFVDYDPNGQFESLGVGETAIDTFTYVVTDGEGGSDTATVSVTVTGANDDPVAVDDGATVDSDQTATINILSNDSDPDATDVLTIKSTNTTGTLGTATVNDNGTAGDASDDFVDYDPNGQFDALGQGDTALDTFTYVVTDGEGGSDTATVTVTVNGVNDPPVAVDDITIGFQDQDVSFNVLTNDSDPNLDPISLLSATLQAGSAGAGTVTFDAAGNVNLDPTSTFSGPAVIDYVISDGRGATDTATLTINIIPNAAPSILEPVSFTVLENTSLAAALQGTDPENDPTTWSIVGGPDQALFSLDPNSGALSFITPPDFENPLDDGGDNGYTLTVQLEDQFSAVTQAILVTVTDDPENGAPVAVDDITIGFQGNPVTFDVLANDSDPDLDALQVISATLVDPADGSVGVNPNETVTFTPDATFTGPTQITYTISDGAGGTDTATLTINMIPNAAPSILEPVSFEVDEGSTLAAALQGSDPEGDTLTWSIIGGPDQDDFFIDANTGELTFVNVPDFDNPLDADGDNRYIVTVQLEDDFNSVSQSVLVRVNEVITNVNPTIDSPVAPPGFPATIVLTGASQGDVGTIGASDDDGDTLVFSLFGEDVNLFEIDPTSGVISIIDDQATGSTLPLSLDGDRIYELDVLVTDGNGGSDVLDLQLPLFLGG